MPRKIEYNKDTYNFIVEANKSKTRKEIYETLGWGESTLDRYMLKNKIYKTYEESCFSKREYSLNEEFFHKWSVDMAYILGFITADGNIDKTCLRIALKSTDVEILEYIKEKMEYSGPIKEVVRKGLSKITNRNLEQVTLAMNSNKMIRKLSEYGVIPHKTGREILPNIPDEYFYDYLRGLSDGDGSLFFYGRKKDRLQFTLSCSNYLFLEQIKEKHRGIGIIRSSGKNSNCFVWRLYHDDCMNFCSSLYYDEDNFSLKRKKDKWIFILEKEKQLSNIIL